MAGRTWEQYEKYLLQRWPLTRREVQIGIECIKGKKNKEIARQLGISAETVNKHLDHIYRATGVNSRDQLVAELLVADIDNTPLQQTLALAGEGASIVGAGFVDTLYASRAERKRPRSPSIRSITPKRAAERSQSVSPDAAKPHRATSEEAAAVAGVGSRASRPWIVAEETRLMETEYESELICPDSLMSTKAGES